MSILFWLFVIFIVCVIAIKISGELHIAGMQPNEKKAYRKRLESSRKAFQQSFEKDKRAMAGEENFPEIICPHCHVKGQVWVARMDSKTISKTGLLVKTTSNKKVNQFTCNNCKLTWE